jgi:hypothetical protein
MKALPVKKGPCAAIGTFAYLIHWEAFAQATTSGLFAGFRTRHDAARSLAKTAAFLVEPQ